MQQVDTTHSDWQQNTSSLQTICLFGSCSINDLYPPTWPGTYARYACRRPEQSSNTTLVHTTSSQTPSLSLTRCPGGGVSTTTLLFSAHDPTSLIRQCRGPNTLLLAIGEYNSIIIMLRVRMRHTHTQVPPLVSTGIAVRLWYCICTGQLACAF